MVALTPSLLYTFGLKDSRRHIDKEPHADR